MSHAHEPPEPPALYAVRDDLDTDEPHDLPAEQAVIGSMLLSTQAITDATDTLYGTEFYRHAHELIWRAAINLRLEGAPVDTVTVAARLQEQGTSAAQAAPPTSTSSSPASSPPPPPATTPRSSATAPPAAPCAQPAAASTTSPEPPAPEASMR
jgi:hypothetical protein